MPILIALQTAMIIAIGTEYGCSVTKANAKSILLTLPASYCGRAFSQYLIGWLPGYGNSIKACSAIAITESVGWAANAYFAAGNADDTCTTNP
jgi:uncharacterized protein (DUF697 family)